MDRFENDRTAVTAVFTSKNLHDSDLEFFNYLNDEINLTFSHLQTQSHTCVVYIHTYIYLSIYISIVFEIWRQFCDRSFFFVN